MQARFFVCLYEGIDKIVDLYIILRKIKIVVFLAGNLDYTSELYKRITLTRHAQAGGEGIGIIIEAF